MCALEKSTKMCVHSYFVESLEKDDYPVITNDGISFDLMEFKIFFFLFKAPHCLQEYPKTPRLFTRQWGFWFLFLAVLAYCNGCPILNNCYFVAPWKFAEVP